MGRIILADAGATKIDWVMVESSKQNGFDIFTSPGVNPIQLSDNDIYNVFLSAYNHFRDHSSIDNLYYYGAGCGMEQTIGKVKSILSSVWGIDNIIVESDMLGAAKSLFGKSKGIACILGTGSNTCLYDNGKICQKVPSLGYILGDEGSGASLGKRLLSDIYKKQLSSNITEIFDNKYHLDFSEVINNVYGGSTPARFLASFAKFLKENISDKEIEKLVLDEFNAFFKKNILGYKDYKEYKIAFTGSIAFHFSKQLIEAGQKFGIEIFKIESSPLKGLIDYHLEKSGILNQVIAC